MMKDTKANILQLFKMEDLGLIKWFLGVSMYKADELKYSMFQEGYTYAIFKQLSVGNCKPVSSPIDEAEYMELATKMEATRDEKK